MSLLFSGPTRVPGGWYDYRPGFAPNVAPTGLPWEQFEGETPGGIVPFPRLECWLAMGPSVNYRYSGVDHWSASLDDYPAIRLLLAKVNRETTGGGGFNAVFCNRYRNERDSIGWHADDESSLGPAAKVQIATVSFGVTRRFEMRRAEGEPLAVELEGGSLFVMGPGLQAGGWVHRVPKAAEPCGERISLTFRRVHAGK